MIKLYNLSDMTISGWKSRYDEIRKEFGFSKKEDFESAWLLDSLLEKTVSPKKIQKIIDGKAVFVIGSGPSLKSSIPYLKKFDNVTKIVADSAVQVLFENKIIPDILVTDLDGDENSLKKIGMKNTLVLVHAHGDNISRLPIVSNFKFCIGTTQTEPIGKIQNFGGFTDGDRCVFLANHFNSKKIILFGMDFGPNIGKYSLTKKSEKKIKLQKLKRAKKLLEWLALKTSSELYTTSNPIKGFKKICYKNLNEILNS